MLTRVLGVDTECHMLVQCVLCRYNCENGRQESFGISLEIETSGLGRLIMCRDKGKGGNKESAQVF